MKTIRVSMVSTLSALALFVAVAAMPGQVQAQTPMVDPTAVQILQRMTDYLDSLQIFSVRTQNTVEDYLESGHRVDYEIAAQVTISRPNKLRSKRIGDMVDQDFYYNGETLTLSNLSNKVYAMEPAPGTIEEMLDYVHESLGLVVPAADLIYRNAFSLLMQDVTLAMVIEKSTIGDVQCDHLLFSRPGVDFQVWIADSGPPLPYKYMITDTGRPGRLSISTVMSDWNEKPSVKDSQFTFVPPKGTQAIEFIPF